MVIFEEMEDSKVKDLTEYAEKVIKYSEKILHCLEDMDKYQERRGGKMRYRRDEEDFEDYPRYR